MVFGKKEKKQKLERGLKRIKCPNPRCVKGLVCIRQPVDADDFGTWNKCRDCQGLGYRLSDK